MAFEFQALPALRAAAWAGLLVVGLWVFLRRPDAAGRAFAFWAVVWGGGIQLVLSLQAMATDVGTQATLGRAAYYAILFSSSAFLALLLYAPRRSARARPLLALAMAPALLAGLAFAADHRPFIVEQVVSGTYLAPNAPLMQVLYHPFIWTGFLAAMVWLAARAPRMEPRAQASATWLMAGLALFAADRFARTWGWWVQDPSTLPGGTDGAIYALFMLAFGPAVLAMVVRARELPGANVALAAGVGAAVGATAFATFASQGAAAGVLLSALVAPLYGALLAKGVLAAPVDAIVPARRARAAVLGEA